MDAQNYQKVMSLLDRMNPLDGMGKVAHDALTSCTDSRHLDLRIPTSVGLRQANAQDTPEKQSRLLLNHARGMWALSRKRLTYSKRVERRLDLAKDALVKLHRYTLLSVLAAVKGMTDEQKASMEQETGKNSHGKPLNRMDDLFLSKWVEAEDKLNLARVATKSEIRHLLPEDVPQVLVDYYS